MELVLKLVTVCAVATLSTAQLNYNNPRFVPEYIQTQSSIVESIQEPPTDQQLSRSNINFQQLPRPDAPRPFYTDEREPSTVLKAPTEDAVVTNFEVQELPPIPSQDMQLPSLVKWNPNNDPDLYYPIVIEKLVPLNVPTTLYPKKYNKNIQKAKTPVLKFKALVDDSAIKQDPLKALYNVAKQDNKNLLKLATYEQEKVNDPEPAESGFGGFSSSSHGSGSVGGLTHDAFSHGLGGNLGGERMDFHIQGHDGPKSYKWGYDTGKGPNRHFRYEERDNHGHVKGHYGYYDKHGKLRIVHYEADPYHGFHASNGDIGPN